MTAPITPDERAAMRERYPRVERPSDPYDEDAWNRYWDDPSPDVLRLLDALDTAEAEVEASRRQHNAAFEIVRASAREYARAAEAWEAQTYEVLNQRDQARAEAAVARQHQREASLTIRSVEGLRKERDDALAMIDRQRDRLRAREEQVRRLRAEVTRLHALVADLRAARPAPVWDEGVALREAVRLYPTEHVGYDRPASSDCQCDECYRREAQRDAYVAGRLAVVREHLPVKPGMEDIYRAWHGTDDPWGGCADRASVERVLDLWPGESRAAVQAEALRAAADEAEAMDADALVAGCAAPVSGERGRQSVIDAARAMCEEPWTWLRARADRLKKGGPA